MAFLTSTSRSYRRRMQYTQEENTVHTTVWVFNKHGNIDFLVSLAPSQKITNSKILKPQELTMRLVLQLVPTTTLTLILTYFLIHSLSTTSQLSKIANPNPLGLLVFLSVMIWISTTVPNCSRMARISGSSVSSDSPPRKTFFVLWTETKENRNTVIFSEEWHRGLNLFYHVSKLLL